MSRPYREIGKPLAMRTIELVRALQLIADSLKEIRQGRVHHLISLAGQLRALLTERSAKADPLLLEMARTLQRTLNVYCMPDVNDPDFPEPLRKDMVLHVSGFPMTPQRQFAAQHELTFPELLDREVIFYRGNTYNVRKIIEWYANWAGGAHYSRQLPEDFAALLSLNPVNLQPIANALVQVGQATLTAGRDLLKSIVDVEIHAIIVVPPQRHDQIGEVNWLLDARYDGSDMRLALMLNKRLMPSFLVCGLQGVCARVDSDRLVDWSAPRHLHASASIDESLDTVLELAVDGQRVGRLRVPEPLFVLSDPLDYDLFHNRAVDGEPQQFSFGFSEVIMFGRELAPVDSANILLHCEARRKALDSQLVLYTPLSFGRAERGTKDMKMTGSVQHTKVRDALAATIQTTTPASEERSLTHE